jgi:hypothetical protein
MKTDSLLDRIVVPVLWAMATVAAFFIVSWRWLTGRHRV